MSNEHCMLYLSVMLTMEIVLIIGRLLAETNTLPKCKLHKIKQFCDLNAKPFEYAFLLDALGDEQAQGIAIDIARCFLNTKKMKILAP
jgi:bifunctional enzyme CysN/CysC